jgi:hypothetical protein
MKHDMYKLRRDTNALIGRSAKTLVVQYVSAITGLSQADVIRNADKIKLSMILDAEITEENLVFDWESWRDLQLGCDDVNLT